MPERTEKREDSSGSQFSDHDEGVMVEGYAGI